MTTVPSLVCPTSAVRSPRRARSDQAIEARNRRVEQYRAVVRPLAVHYSRCSQESLEDLLQVGLMGLIRAAELYSEARRTPFEAFARPHIRGAILHYLRDAAPLVRLPRRQAELQERFNRLQGRLPHHGSPVDVVAHLCRSLGISVAEWRRLEVQRQLSRPCALNDEELATVPAPCPVPIERPMDGSRSVEEMMGLLEPRERLVVQQVVLCGWSYRRLGRQMRVSPMTVKRLLHRGLEGLRQRLDREDGLNPAGPAGRGASAVPGL
jgi:RNA polymerase sigma-B factor